MNGTYLMQSNKGLKARLRDHVPNIKKGLFDNLSQRLVKFHTAQINIQRSIQPSTKTEVGVEQHYHICKKNKKGPDNSFYVYSKY